MRLPSALCTFALLIGTALTCLAAKPESKGPEPDALLRTLYKAHNVKKGPFFSPKNRSLAGEYFTTELASLIVKDAVKSKGEVGAYEFDALYQSQDPVITNFKIGDVQWGGILKHKEGEPERSLAAVAVSFKDGGKSRVIHFHFQQQADKTWRSPISNIRTAHRSSEFLRASTAPASPGKPSKTPLSFSRVIPGQTSDENHPTG